MGQRKYIRNNSSLNTKKIYTIYPSKNPFLQTINPANTGESRAGKSTQTSLSLNIRFSAEWVVPGSERGIQQQSTILRNIHGYPSRVRAGGFRGHPPRNLPYFHYHTSSSRCGLEEYFALWRPCRALNSCVMLCCVVLSQKRRERRKRQQQQQHEEIGLLSQQFTHLTTTEIMELQTTVREFTTYNCRDGGSIHRTPIM